LKIKALYYIVNNTTFSVVLKHHTIFSCKWRKSGRRNRVKERSGKDKFK